MVISGGYGHPNISVIDSDGGECTNVKFPTIPQPDGGVGRLGSLMGVFGSKIVICGGQSNYSVIYQDCQMLDVLNGYAFRVNIINVFQARLSYRATKTIKSKLFSS